jgi:hypothetical protein
MPPKKQNETIHITKDDLEEIVRKAVRGELEHVGLFSDDGRDRQQLQQDFAFLRKTRMSIDSASGVIGKAVLGAIIVAIIGFVVAGAKLGVIASPK